ncbi:hypothetical protein HY256_11395 [Candidatus Sumerlaeota bacterium]|nr:hypothetical protein [Candidatus Sumerlaeota bacterium]
MIPQMNASRLVWLAAAALFLLLPAGFIPGEDEQNPPEESKKVRKIEPIASIEEWRRVDQRLVESSRKFMDLARRQRELRDRLDKAGEGYVPGEFDPRSVTQHRKMADISAKLDGTLREARQTREDIGKTLVRVANSKPEIKQLLNARQEEVEKIPETSRTTEQSHDLDRAAVWRDGMRRAEEEGPHVFLLGLFGEQVGREIAASLGSQRLKNFAQRRRNEGPPPPQVDAPPPPPGGEGAPRPDDHGPPNIKELRDRLARLERAHERAEAIIARQKRDIEQLRAELDRLRENRPIQPNPEKEP